MLFRFREIKIDYSSVENLILALRPKQWLKNLFLFLPLVFGKKLFDFPVNLEEGMAFILFCAVTGSAYLANDLIDFGKDRLHPVRRLRPVASGKIDREQGWVAFGILSIAALALSFVLNPVFGGVVAAYLLGSLVYSMFLKNVVILDIFCVGGFFLLRIIAGTVVAEVPFSYWMIFAAVLLAFLLALGKRRQELILYGETAAFHPGSLRRYNIHFIDQMIHIVASSIVITYMLYTVDARTVSEFGNRHLMITIPFVFFGIFRYLYLLHRGAQDGDPTRILFSDKPLQANLVLWGITCIAVIYF